MSISEGCAQLKGEGCAVVAPSEVGGWCAEASTLLRIATIVSADGVLKGELNILLLLPLVRRRRRCWCWWCS